MLGTAPCATAPCTSIVRTTDGGASWWQGFEVGRPDKPRRLPADAVIYDWIPSLDDFRDPFSPLQAALLDVSVSVMLGRYAYSFLRNGATPATVVVVEEFPDEQARRRARASSGTAR